jgi:hypothetical protein
MDRPEKERDERIRWGWVVACLVVGVTLIALAYVVDAPRWDSRGVTPSFLVEVGAAFTLAGVLFLLERKFVGQVIQASTRATREVARQAEQRFQERTDELSARLDDLQDRLVDRVGQTAREQDDKLSALDDNPGRCTRKPPRTRRSPARLNTGPVRWRCLWHGRADAKLSAIIRGRWIGHTTA